MCHVVHGNTESVELIWQFDSGNLGNFRNHQIQQKSAHHDLQTLSYVSQQKIHQKLRKSTPLSSFPTLPNVFIG